MWRNKLLVLLFIGVASAAFYEDLLDRVQKNLQPGAQWKPGLNKRFGGVSRPELEILAGTRLNGGSSAPALNISGSRFRRAIGTSFDARTFWPKCSNNTGFIRDQACCGSCWAVSSASVMTDRHCIKSNGTFTGYISEEKLMTCCTSCIYNKNGCNGGYPSNAFYYWTYTGVPTGGPYNSNQGCQPYALSPQCYSSQYAPACSTKCLSGYKVVYSNYDLHKGSSYYSLKGAAAMQTEIMTNGPIVATFNVYHSFYTYSSGVYACGTVAGDYLVGGHAVKIIGWGVNNDTNNTPYWLVVNSWNVTWGDKGFFKILRGTNTCGFESACYAGLAKS